MFLIFAIIAQSFAAQANLDFVATTNVPGVSVEGKASDVFVNVQEGKAATASLEFDVFKLQTGMDKRDQHLREKVFGAKSEGDVKISFSAQGLECVASKCLAKGVLKIKDQAKEIEIPLEKDGSDLNLKGKTTILLSDFKLPRPSFMGVKVEDSVEISIKVME